MRDQPTASSPTSFTKTADVRKSSSASTPAGTPTHRPAQGKYFEVLKPVAHWILDYGMFIRFKGTPSRQSFKSQASDVIAFDSKAHLKNVPKMNQMQFIQLCKTMYDMLSEHHDEQKIYHALATVGTLLLQIGKNLAALY